MLSAGLNIVNAMGSGAQTMLTGTANGCTVGRLTMTNGDAVQHTVTVSRVNGSNTTVVGSFNIVASAGTVPGVLPMDVLAQVFQGVPINLAPGELLTYALSSAMAAGTVMYCHAEYGAF